MATRRRDRWFEDRHVDDRMRLLIPRFVRLAVLLTLVSAPILAPTPGRAWATCGNALAALLVSELLTRAGLLQRATRAAVGALMLAFVALIATGSLASGHPEAYGLLQTLPVAFGAFFFSGAARFALPVAAAGAQYLVCLPLHVLSLAAAGVQLVVLLLLARFVVEVAKVLREALTAHNALHSLLQAATEDPTAPALARQGLRAALDVTGWDAGAVLLLEDGRLLTDAVVGLPPEWVGPGAWHGPTEPFLQRALAEAAQTHVADVRAELGPTHPLAVAGFAALGSVPIRYHERVIGLLLVAQHGGRPMDERERQRLDEVGAQLGLALGNARSRQREQRVADDLRELNRRKDEFLSLISHELRTPTTSIELGAQTLRRGVGRLDRKEHAEVLDTLADRSRELRELVESVLAVALADTGELPATTAAFDWNTSLRQWARQEEERSGRQVVTELPDQRVFSMVDAAKVHRIVLNLLSNAVKFSPPGTPVTVALTATDRTVQVAVRDEGEGIPPELQQAVFERFYQVDAGSTRLAGGLGLGLSLAHQLAHMCGGTLEVDSTPGAGSTFRLELPLVPLPGPAELAEVPVSPGAP